MSKIFANRKLIDFYKGQIVMDMRLGNWISVWLVGFAHPILMKIDLRKKNQQQLAMYLVAKSYR